MITAEVWQANLGRGVTVDAFCDNLARLVAAVGLGGFLALQEVDEADVPEEGDAIAAALDSTHVIHHPGRLNPIAVPRGVDVLDAGAVHGCDGLARVTPARWITYVVAELGEGLTLAVVNFHLPILRAGTLTRRARMRLALRRLVRELRRAGHIVYVCGDTNTRRPRFAKWTDPIREAIAAGIDRAWITAPRRHPWRVVVLAGMTLNLTIDNHDAHGARLGFPRRRRA